ncbi:MAG: chlorophyll synthase ChlG [Gammaproteobacteria bacterium]|nr:chlorophyll synthase ChlG [Gammaproteobacteria bacterium]
MSRPGFTSVVELLKPVTWFPPMWAFACGVVSTGQPLEQRWGLVLTGLLLTGPLVCGTSQAVNDWFDRHVDAINEPGRPIPSGRVPGHWGLYVACVWTLLSLAVAPALGPWGFGATVLALLLAWGYSAPPFRFKRNGWLGNSACAVSYEGLAWVTGAAVMMNGAMPDGRTLALAGLYSLGAHGIMTLNDFKSVQGDRQCGVDSLPVLLGISGACRAACLLMTVAQVAVAALLVIWGHALHAAGVGLLLTVQLVLMTRLLRDPVARATWYSGFGVTLYVLGMLLSAFALR